MVDIIKARPTDRDQLRLTANGTIAETGMRGAHNAGTILVSGTVQAGLLGLRAGDLVTNVHCWVSVVGATLTYARMGLYDSAGTQLGLSGDEIATFEASTGILTIALATPVSISTSGGYYVAVLNTGTTPATLVRSGSTAGAGSGVGSGVPLYGAEAAQTALDATVTLAEASVAYWYGVS